MEENNVGEKVENPEEVDAHPADGEKTPEPETNKLYLSEYCSTRGCKRKATTTKEY